jgi:tocopherol O-methyltransferase
MGDRWHHGDPEAEARGLSFLEACEVLEDTVVSEAKVAKGQWVLDFGSGVGGPTRHMAKRSGARFVGITNNEFLSQKARHYSAETAEADKLSFLTVGDTDYLRLPFPDASFDAVTFYESVCHLPDKAAFFRQVQRILKPGGRLAGIDWLQRPYGEHKTEEQIMRFMAPVNEYIRIPWHGSVRSYSEDIASAGLKVLVARDLFEGKKCWGSTPPEQRDAWLSYEGQNKELFRKGKEALDAARESGVFTVGMFVAEKPAA